MSCFPELDALITEQAPERKLKTGPRGPFGPCGPHQPKRRQRIEEYARQMRDRRELAKRTK